MTITADQATRDYGGGDDWTLTRSELLPLGNKVTIKQLLQMAEMDETMAAMSYAIETSLAKVNWRHLARDNGEESDSDEAIDAADFADTLLKDMESPLQTYIENALSFMVAGHSLAEILFRQRTQENGSRFSDNLWGVRDLRERSQLSVVQWVSEGGRVVAFRQANTRDSGIPLAKCMHLTSKGAPNRPQGKSMFKAAYRMFLLKRRIQDSEAIGIERDLCGLPVMTMPQEDIDAATNNPDTPQGKAAAARVRAAQSAVSDLRLNEAGGLVMPSNTYETETDGKPSSVPKYDFKIVTSAGSRSIDTRGAIREYDLAMTRIAMMQFLRLGDRAGGSYALSDTQSSLAMRAIIAIIEKIAFEWKLKVLTTIFLLNGMDLRYLPDLGATSITEDSVESVSVLLEAMAAAEDILNADPELMDDVKSKLGPRRRKKLPAPMFAADKTETPPADE